MNLSSRNFLKTKSYKFCIATLVFSIYFFLVFLSERALAIPIYGFHTGSCDRELGIILDIKPLEITFLSLKGEVRTIKKFEIIYLSSYFITEVPIDAQIETKESAPIRVYTKSGQSELITLVEGWPIDFTHDKISFLTLDGNEAVIDRSSIWQIEQLENSKIVRLAFQGTQSLTFDMPHPFRNCKVTDQYPTQKAFTSGVSLYPQQTLSEPLAIKREFDRLQQSYSELKNYFHEQPYYARPQYYINKSSLGIWLPIGSRYGSSESRTNLFLPVLTSEVSTGPFSYQHQIVTGVAPLAKGSHEEAHSQVYYSFKASYFHLSAYFDPNLMLVGQKYDWRANDFSKTDVKFHDKSFFEFGVDYGPWALQFHLNNTVNLGVLVGSEFRKADLQVPRFGLSYTGLASSGEFFLGQANLSEGDVDFDFSIKRINYQIQTNRNIAWTIGYIQRIISLDGPFEVHDDAQSAVLMYSQNFRKKLKWAFLLASEFQSLKYSIPGQGDFSEQHLYPKFSSMVSLEF